MKHLPKLYNILFFISCFLLISFTMSNLTTVIIWAIGDGETGGGAQLGGILTNVSLAGCQFPPLLGTGPDPICTAIGCVPNPANNGVQVTPYGYSTTGFCPPRSMPTSLGVITIGSLGWTILGLGISTPVLFTPKTWIGTGLP